MVDKVNGKVQSGEFLGKQLDFYVANFTADLNTVANPTVVAAGQASGANAATITAADTEVTRAGSAFKRRERVVETVALNGQPIIMGELSSTTSGSQTFKFAIEHADAWRTNTSGTLGSKLDAGAAALEAALGKVAGITGATVTVADKLS